MAKKVLLPHIEALKPGTYIHLHNGTFDVFELTKYKTVEYIGSDNVDSMADIPEDGKLVRIEDIINTL